MADDWDLYAVVRSCKATTSATTTATATVENNASFDNPFFINSLLDEKPDQFQMFEEIYSTTTTTTTTTATATTPLTKQLQTPLQLLQQKHHVMQRVQNIEFKNITFPITSSQPIRPRKKKNQLTKKVRQFTQAELSNDSWAWRKYGQKPIKGSPYPRNYYKCSTTKDCPARKQVECSPTDSNIYIVSYTGEHTHPRPTHRSSLAGSTRTKFSPPPIKPSSTEANTSTMPADIVFPYPRPSCSSSSPVASSSSFSPSPNTPLMEDMSIPNEFKDTFTGFQ